MARQPKYMPSSFCVRGWVTFMKPGFFEEGNGPLTAALADTRIPHDSPHVDVYEPLAAVGVPKHMEAKSR